MRVIFLRAKFKALRYFSMWRYRRLLAKTPPVNITPESTSPVSAAMLCGQSTLHKGIGAAKSFYRFFPEGIPFHWHDDGSLSEVDQSLIRHHLPGVRIISRGEADRKVQAYLEVNGFARLAAHRKKHALFLKFIDVPFFSQKRFLQFDSDVLCLQIPDDLISAMQTQNNFLSRYNKDFGPAMAYPDSDLEHFLHQPILPWFNSGLFLTSVANLEDFYSFAERLLACSFDSSNSHLLEQTLWAAWCTAQSGAPLPDEYDCTFRFGRGGPGSMSRVITQHYCAFASALFFEEFALKVYPQLAPCPYLSRVVLGCIDRGIFNVAH
jgi:hypothetical protein